jgi:hypothetical protein
MTQDIERAVNKLEVGVSTPDQIRERLGLGPDTPNAEVEELWANMLVTVDTYPVDSQLHLGLMAESMEGFINLTLARRWAIVRWERRALATSDTPVALVRDPDSPLPGLGFGSAGRLMVPLSRRVGLTLGSVGNVENFPRVSCPGPPGPLRCSTRRPSATPARYCCITPTTTRWRASRCPSPGRPR